MHNQSTVDDKLIIDLYYPISEIREEVKMRTSYLGRFRRTEDNPHLLDLLAFTEDDNDLFMSYAHSAMTMVFPSISKLAKELNNAYEFRILDNPPLGDTYANSMHFKLLWSENLDTNYLEPLDQSVKDAICWYIIWRWLMLVFAYGKDDIATAYANFGKSLKEASKNSTSLVGSVINRTPRIF